MPRKLVEQVKKRHFDLEEALSVWDTWYVPFICFLDPERVAWSNERVRALQARDASDVPTAQVAEMLGVHLVLANDKDLAAFEIIPENARVRIMAAYQSTGEEDLAQLGITLGSGVVLWVSMAAIRSLIVLISKVNRWLLLALVVALGLALAIPPTRRWLKKQSQPFLEYTQQYACSCGERIEAVIDELAELHLEAVEAEQFIPSPRAVEQPRLVWHYILRVLATAPGPLSASEIATRMAAQGYRAKGAHPERYVSRLLHASPDLFEQTESRYWRFRSHRE